jgi:hypothetical protein
VYLLNRAPTKILQGRTPYEAWYKRKPAVHHLRTFGCLVHVKKVGPGISKLTDRSTPMVFIGYETGTKGYRVYDPIAKKLHISRDVIFEEGKAWNWQGEAQPDPTASVFDVEFYTVAGQGTVTDSAVTKTEGAEAAGWSDSEPATELLMINGSLILILVLDQIKTHHQAVQLSKR